MYGFWGGSRPAHKCRYLLAEGNCRLSTSVQRAAHNAGYALLAIEVSPGIGGAYCRLWRRVGGVMFLDGHAWARPIISDWRGLIRRC